MIDFPAHAGVNRFSTGSDQHDRDFPAHAGVNRQSPIDEQLAL